MAEANPEYARVPLEPGALRRTRISAIGDIPWGTHLCQFYQDKQDLIDILVPYFKAGLEDNEVCMWVTSEPLRSAEAKAALAANVENLETYIANGQLEILNSEWYASGGEFESDLVLQSWIDRLEAARLRGFAGLRLTGDPSWLEKPEWRGFMEYEAAVNGIFGQCRMLAICTYSLSKCDALQIMDVISNHKFALVKRAGKWEVLAHGDTVLHSNQAQRLANVGSWERDIATEKVRWSDQMYRIYGLADHTQPVFRTFLNLVHPKDLGIISEAQKRVLAANAPIEVEYRITRPDGEVRFIRSIAEVVTNEHGAPLRLVGTDQDITEQVKAMELLRESEARLKTAQHIAHVGDWIWDFKTNRALWWSEEMFRIMGQPLNYEPTFEGSLQMTAPGDRERMAQWVRDCLEEKKGKLIEARIVRPTGEVRTLVCTSEVLLDEDGLPERMVGTCQDVTDARRAQEESFARQKLESLGTLASGIAHDFNNLLGAMLTQAELAAAELATGSHPEEALKQIQEVAIRGSEIVRQLMIYAGKEGDVLELTDVSKAVEGMLELLKVTVSPHATLVADLDQNLPAVNARPAQLRQIVMNLVVNASDAIKKHEGLVRVATRCVTIGTAGATSEGLAQGEYVQLEVSDTGIGMSSETTSRVFDPFFTTKSAGRGLGLAVVHGIVRNLNGAIRVISELGNGATFQILLPCAAAAASANTGTVAGVDEPPAPFRGATVLVVEDEHPLRWAVTKMLGNAGFRVLQVDNGSEAIGLLQGTGEIDAILLDLTIPGAPSQEVLAEAVQVRPSIKIILTSAYSEETARTVLKGPQIGGYVRKPFHFDHLVRTLRSVLSSNVPE